jgi:LPXTG-site transpeptidase (sortase) family protein
MKNISKLRNILILIVILAVASGLFMTVRTLVSKRGEVVESPIDTGKSEEELMDKASAFETLAKPVYANPKRLSIKSIKLDMAVNSVGVLPDGSLETPKDWYSGGWYRKSSKPGEPGNMIINAHYDDSFGRPAAFWQLKSVKVNDTVTVLDELGVTYEYKVTESYYLDVKDPNRLKIFENEGQKSTITMITCGGVWLPNAANYSKRLVVKGELINPNF